MGQITVPQGRLKFAEMSEKGMSWAGAISFEAGQGQSFARTRYGTVLKPLTDDLEGAF